VEVLTRTCRQGSRSSFSAPCVRFEGEIATHLNDAGRGEKLREGLFFAITGAPNVGESTLALAERDVAIVSDIPGHHAMRWKPV
jgi:tRNA U34 5-carboxymethylaminomethyl modifying GTPase MnmE/TrmE